MEFLTQLWLPIVVSAVLVFLASAIIHMATPFHKGDFRKLPQEDAILDALRAHGVQPGAYMFPCAGSMKEMSSPEMREKIRRGPVGWLTVGTADAFNMNRSLVLWMLYCLVVAVFVAYVGWHALGAGASYLAVFRITGAAAVLGHAVGQLHNSIWRGASWATTTFIIDSLSGVVAARRQDVAVLADVVQRGDAQKPGTSA